MGQKEDLKAFETVRAELNELVRQNPAVFGKLVGSVEKFNSLVKKIRDDLKAEARSTGRKIRAGDFEAIPRDRTAFDLAAVQLALKLAGQAGQAEWDALIAGNRVKVTYSTDKEGVAAISALETRYPQLMKLKGKETYKVDSPGPKEIALGDIAGMVENA